MTCFLDATNSFLKQLDSMTICRYVKELAVQNTTQNESIDTSRSHQNICSQP